MTKHAEAHRSRSRNALGPLGRFIKAVSAVVASLLIFVVIITIGQAPIVVAYYLQLNGDIALTTGGSLLVVALQVGWAILCTYVTTKVVNAWRRGPKKAPRAVRQDPNLAVLGHPTGSRWA